MNKEFKTYDHGLGPVDLKHLGSCIELEPTELHIKQNGAKDHSPSFTIVLEDIGIKVYPTVVGDISLNRLKEGLQKLGYDVIKLNKLTHHKS